MAFNAKVKPWPLIRWGLVASWLSTLLTISYLDYGRPYTLWTNVTLDPTGWWNEIAFLTLGFLIALELTYHWEKKSKKVVYVVRSSPKA